MWVGLATFAGDGTTDAGLARTFDAIRGALDSRASRFCGGPKQVDLGLAQAANELFNNSPSSGIAEQRVILITDGKELPRAALDAARHVRSLGVIVDVVSYGPEADVGLLDQLAAQAGGTHFHADQAKQIDEALFRIEEGLAPSAIIVNQ